jgi:hypothetical protein
LPEAFGVSRYEALNREGKTTFITEENAVYEALKEIAQFLRLS